MSSPDYSQAVKDIIDGLGDSPTPDAIYHAVRNYSVDHVVAASAAAAKAGGGGGGGSQPTERGVFGGGDTVTIDDGSTDYLTWSDGGYPGGPVLDLTDPTAPVVLASGIYAVTASVKGQSLTADGLFEVFLYMDADGDGIVVASDSRLSTAAQPFVHCAVSCSYYIPEGGAIRVRVANFDGASARVFENENVTVQRAT